MRYVNTKVIILGDFNTDIEQRHIKYFWDSCGLNSIIKQSACHKNLIVY